ncbi:MAG: peptide deformylase [Armatimonadota bacterium]|nr:peptide deformylase [Armatimonadota bacterium]
MSSEEIVLYGDDILRKPTKPVDLSNSDLKELIEHMIEVMREAPGVGLAANQVGIDKRLFVYDVGEGPSAILNPKIIKQRGKEIATEGCLSIPGLQGDVRRAAAVVVEGLDPDGNEVRVEADGLLARVFQHEIDHLNGTLFIDRADPDTLAWVSEVETEEE